MQLDCDVKKNSPDPLKDQPSRTPGYDNAVDELNLAEFPLAAISDRFPAGMKTVTLEDTVYDRIQKQHLPRRLILSGSDRYGLPTSKDDDVLLACVQLSRLNDFASREVTFSRYEILRLLGWADESRNYERVATSLRRWKGLSIFSDRAFYDHAQKSWVNRDFGVFDNLVIYRREVIQGKAAPGVSRFVWNEVLYRSFQSGYLKQLDWDLYCRFQSPVAKRLYRFLDKRFYHGHRVEIDLRELAFRKLRLAGDYNTAQIKRTLLKGIQELEQLWDLKTRDPAARFVRQSAGRWMVVFERKSRPPRIGSIESAVLPGEVTSSQSSEISLQPESTPQQLQRELTKRGIGPAAAEELSLAIPAKRAQELIELYDWYNNHGQPRGPGFLVQALRKPDHISFPPGFESSSQRRDKQLQRDAQKQAEQRVRTRREREAAEREKTQQRAFMAFWSAMSPNEQESFENEALDKAEPLIKRLYFQHSGKRGKEFGMYRRIILQKHFLSTHRLA